MKHTLSLVFIALSLASSASAERIILNRVVEPSGTTTSDYIVTTAQIEKTPLWNVGQEIPMDLDTVIAIVKEEYPGFETGWVESIMLESIGHRKTIEGSHLSYKYKWFYSVHWLEESSHCYALVLFDGTIIKPQQVGTPIPPEIQGKIDMAREEKGAVPSIH